MRRLFTIFAVLVALVAVHDVVAPHGRGLAARTAIGAIDEYKAHVSPHLRGVVVCRFQPTCSTYGREAIMKYGFARGVAKTAWRIARCGPWTKQGTVDRP